MLDATTAAMAQSIQSLHAATFAGFEPLQPPAPTGNDPVYLAALHACSQLGFIAHDAECLARAWLAQSTRTGQFDAALWPSDPRDFGLQTTPRASAFVTCPQALGLYAVLPNADWVGRMARAGVPTVQLRYKSDDAVAIAQEVRKAVAAVAGTPALLFINDHWREAIAAGAYGVHLGQEDLDALTPEELQTLRDSGLRLGVSTHGVCRDGARRCSGPQLHRHGRCVPYDAEKNGDGTARAGAAGGLCQAHEELPPSCHRRDRARTICRGIGHRGRLHRGSARLGQCRPA